MTDPITAFGHFILRVFRREKSVVFHPGHVEVEGVVPHAELDALRCALERQIESDLRRDGHG